MKITNNQDRSKLSEGRSYQMGFAFLKKVGDEEFETIQPISPCKDYLNDVVYSEATGKAMSAYGFSSKKKNIFDGQTSYLAISICPYQNGIEYAGYEKDKENLDTNLENMVKFMNYFDEELKLNVKTSINKVEENLYIVSFDYFWCQYTYLISLFSLLLRVGQFYKGKNSPIDYLATFTDFPSDTYLVQSALPKLRLILGGSIPVQDMLEMKGGQTVHNCGIIGFKIAA